MGAAAWLQGGQPLKVTWPKMPQALLTNSFTKEKLKIDHLKLFAIENGVFILQTTITIQIFIKQLFVKAFETLFV